MNVVTRFENFIERLMERTFTRATRSHLQPVEVGKRLVRVMEAEQSVGIDGILVPNVYDIYLSPTDYAHFEPARRSFTQNLEAHAARVARQRRFHMIARPLVRLHEARDLNVGDLRITPRLEDVERERNDVQHTAILPTLDERIETRPLAPALVYSDQRFAVLRSPTRVGRQADNDIVVNDPRVSRHHAEVIQRGERWVIRDAGSRNGTSVNGKIVSETPLTPGDRISLGGCDLTWEQ